MDSATLVTLAFSLLALLVGAVLGWLLASRPEGRLRGARPPPGRPAAAAPGWPRRRTKARPASGSGASPRRWKSAPPASANWRPSWRRPRGARPRTTLRLNAFVADTEKRFTDTFKSLASQILEEKTAKFTATNETKLNELLNPFRERLKDFQKKIEDTHLSETSERRSLKDELKRLMELNQQVSQDTKNLTTALKGEAKTQGTWGEIILERVLEMSGLTRGREYVVQESLVAEDGNRQQPDVRDLPAAQPQPDRGLQGVAGGLRALRQRGDRRGPGRRPSSSTCVSLRNHIKDLSEKNYPALYGLESLDFVLMFVPVEPAFMAAVQADPGLYEAAWREERGAGQPDHADGHGPGGRERVATGAPEPQRHEDCRAGRPHARRVRAFRRRTGEGHGAVPERRRGAGFRGEAGCTPAGATWCAAPTRSASSAPRRRSSCPRTCWRSPTTCRWMPPTTTEPDADAGPDAERPPQPDRTRRRTSPCGTEE